MSKVCIGLLLIGALFIPREVIAHLDMHAHLLSATCRTQVGERRLTKRMHTLSALRLHAYPFRSRLMEI
jgi:hypothetical protein